MEDKQPNEQMPLSELEQKDFDSYKTWINQFKIESWQPELVVSGVAIFATIQLAGFIGQIFKIAQANTDGIFQLTSYVICYYLQIMIFALMLNFIFHFILRTFWIGIIGLKAAYPQGIDFDKISATSPYFKKAYKEQLKDINHFSWQLDRLCSGLFSFSFMGVLILLGSIILVVLSQVITYGILALFPISDIKAQSKILVATLMVLFIPSFSSILALFPGIKNNERINKVLFFIYWHVNPIYFLFVKPFHYVSLTFGANLNFKKYSLLIAIYMFFLMTGFQYYSTINSDVALDRKAQLKTNRAFLSNPSSLNTVNSNMYDNLRGDENIQIAAIQSDVIYDDYIRLLVNYPKKEERWLLELCPQTPKQYVPDSLSKSEKRKQKDEYALQCFQKYLQIELDGTIQSNVDWLFYNHSGNKEIGLITYIPIQQQKIGKHILSVKKNTPKDTDPYPKDIDIPFWIGTQ